jgi:tRNA(Ile)-lysidine synthase
VEHGTHLPISNTEADNALGRLARFDHLVLAVSGGPDSMALLVLAAEWSARRSNLSPAISVATVDHGLRPESGAEAMFVGREARRLGLSHTILRWTCAKPTTGLADAARQARYRLLEEHARGLAAGATAVVTAHHQDDQAETFAMRLARGAGVDGLAAMPPERALLVASPVVLVRPLLQFPKSRLLATLEARRRGFVEDPSNEDIRYERPRLRRLFPALDAAGISAPALARSARRLGEAQVALRYAEELFVKSLDLTFGNEVFAAFDREAFSQGPAYLRQKVLARLVARYGGASPEPQLSEIEDLTARLQRDEKCTATLGGAMISGGSRLVRVWREAGRLDQRGLDLSPGESQIWDRRFILRWAPVGSGTVATPVTIRPLGAENYSRIAGRLAATPRRPPARAAHSLPSFWAGGELLAVPSLAPFAMASQPPLDRAGCELRALALPTAC